MSTLATYCQGVATSRRTWLPEDGPLAPEVAHVCVNGLVEFRHWQQQERVPELRRIATLLFAARFPRDLMQVWLRKLFSAAIEELEQPEERAAAPHAVGLQESESYGKTLIERQRLAAAAYSKLARHPIELNTYRQDKAYERAIIISLGRCIEKLERQLDRDESKSSTIIELDSTYIRRSGLYAELGILMAERHRIVGLVGEGGVGKSTLAKNYIRETIPEGSAYIFIDLQSKRHLSFSLHREFTRLGISTAELSESSAELLLGDLLASPDQCPAYVLLDNADDRELLGLLTPSPTASVIFITTRDERVLPKSAARVFVGDLTTREAFEAITARLPNISKSELKVLEMLDGRALAIDIICTFLLRCTPSRRSSFLKLLKRKASDALGKATAILAMPSLEAACIEIILHLESDKHRAPAVRLLEFHLACFIATDFDCMYDAYSTHVSQGVVVDGEISAQEEYDFALETLMQYHVVREHGDRPIRYLWLHPLTAEIMLSINAIRKVLPDRCRVILEPHVEKLYELKANAEGVLSSPVETRSPSDLHRAMGLLLYQCCKVISSAYTGIKYCDCAYFRELQDLGFAIKEIPDLYFWPDGHVDNEMGHLEELPRPPSWIKHMRPKE